MASTVIYGPHPRVRLIPGVIAMCAAMCIGSFCVAYFNINGLREPAGYLPSIVFFAFAVIFFILYWRKFIRITLSDEAMLVERLFPGVRQIAFVRYSEVATIDQARMSLKLILRAQDGKVLFVIPDTISKVSGELTPVAESSIPSHVEGLLLEIYQLRQEIARRAGLLK